MERRKYSIKEIQKMTKLSPSDLQDILKRYKQHFAMEIVPGPAGEEVFMDQVSFERLMFIKQLELRQGPSHEETLNQLIDPSSTHTVGPAEIPREGLENLKVTVDQVAEEIGSLGKTLEQVMTRYNQVLKDLHQFRAENRQLQRELEMMRNRQNLLIGQLKQEEPFADEGKEKETIN